MLKLAGSFFGDGARSPRGRASSAAASKRDSELGTSEKPAVGVGQIMRFLDTRKSSACAAPKDVAPDHVVAALGRGWELRGGLGSGAYAKVFEASWVGTEADVVGERVQCAIKVMRDVDMESWEISRRFVRELLILRRLREAPGVVSLYGCSTPAGRSSRHRRDLYLWFEACAVDFRQLTKMECYLEPPDARRLTRELFEAIRHVHAKDVIHRDIKPANLLLHGSGALKVCDFGLARIAPREPAPSPSKGENHTPTHVRLPVDDEEKFHDDDSTFDRSKLTDDSKNDSKHDDDDAPILSQDVDVGDGESDDDSLPPPGGTPVQRPAMRRTYTEHVVTRWYRAPELVLLQPYDFSVDVWACACVVAECFLGTCKEVCEFREGRRPLFPGRSCFPLSPAAGSRGGWHQKNDQLTAIFRVRGTPSADEVDSLAHDYKGMKAYLRRLQPREPSDLARLLPGAPADAVDLLDGMLKFLPEDRPSLDTVLDHAYLRRTAAEARAASDAARSLRPAFLPPSETAVGPAMSRIEDDDAWERVAQHKADRDMSNVLWKLVEKFPTELAPRGGLLGSEDYTPRPQPAQKKEKKRSLSAKMSGLFRSGFGSG